jgi:hypothetical protein
MKSIALLLLFVLLLAFGGCDIGKYIPKTSHTMHKATVLKVYSTSDGGFDYVSYVVEVGGTEVVVNDPLGRSSHKVGDTIEYIAQKIEMNGGKKMLTFTLIK